MQKVLNPKQPLKMEGEYLAAQDLGRLGPSQIPPIKQGKSRFRRWGIGLALLLIFGLLLIVFRSPLLIGVAKLWIVDDPIEKADAIVVLGGGLQTRPFKAAELYRNGFAPIILVMNVQPNATAQLKITELESDITKMALLKEGVASTNIFITSQQVASTFDEARVLKEWAQSNKVQRLIIPTTLFHTRRVKWIFRRSLEDSAIDIRVVAIPERTYNQDNWWKHEDGLVAFQSEMVKMLYYRLKY